MDEKKAALLAEAGFGEKFIKLLWERDSALKILLRDQRKKRWGRFYAHRRFSQRKSPFSDGD